MNLLLSPQPPFFPHQHDSSSRISPPRSISPYPNMASRKRKADDDGDEMSVSPLSSPAIATRQISRPNKRARAVELSGRPLALPRLLETLSSDELRNVLQRICERHPTVGQEVVADAPRPSVTAALNVLDEYRAKLAAAVPYGESSPEYTYYRVRAPLVALIDALSDFTPQYLPPTENQATTSLPYLDGATKIVHSLPDWEPPSYRHHKDSAYDEISRAWALVISEAAKRGGGLSLLTGGWDRVLEKHHQESNGRLGAAMNAMARCLGWMNTAAPSSSSSAIASDPTSRFNQLMAGTIPANSAVRVGHF